MSASQPALFNVQEFTDNGVTLVGGRLYTYAFGTTTQKVAYTDPDGLVPQTYTADGLGGQYIALNARGELPTPLYLAPGPYDISLRRADGSTVWVRRAHPTSDSTDALSAALVAAPGSSLVGYSPAISGLNASTVQKRLRLEAIHIEEFSGVTADGVANDGPAIRAAIIACQAAGKMLVFGGVYAVDRITVQDGVYNFAMHSDNAQFFGIATSSQPGIIELVNCVDFHMTGNWRLHGADNVNYESGLCIRAQTGTAQATTRVNIYNVTVRNCAVGIAVGRYAIDYQCSEINIFGANFFKCPIGVYNAGANTGAQYIGCNIVSEPNAAFPAAVEKAIWQEGGFVKVVGGSIFSNPTAAHAILQNPCMSTIYGNSYGSMNIVGAHCEVNSKLMVVTNSRALPAPVSDSSSFAFNSCAGFCGAPGAEDFVFVGDPTYSGTLDIMGNNWYSAAVRTGFNISSASPTMNIVTDKKSMGRNFRNWMSGVFGGKMIHEAQPAMFAHGLSATYPTDSFNVLKFLNSYLGNELGRYGGNYSPATGIFSVPAGGFSRLDVTAGIAGSILSNAAFYLQQNGTTVAYGVWAANIGAINATLYDLVAGDQIRIVFTPYTAPSTSDSGYYNFLQMAAAT